MRRIWPLLIGLTFVGCAGTSPTAPAACPGLNLTGTATVHGTVMSGGAGVSGAVVTLGSRTGNTSGDGTFSITGLPSGTLALAVGPSELQTASGDVLALTGDNVVRIPVAHGNGDGFLAGRTIDGCSGLPLAGVTVSVGTNAATSDASGLYEVDGLCCSTLPPVQASRAGYQTYTTELGRVYNTSEWLDIVLRKP